MELGDLYVTKDGIFLGEIIEVTPKSITLKIQRDLIMISAELIILII